MHVLTPQPFVKCPKPTRSAAPKTARPYRRALIISMSVGLFCPAAGCREGRDGIQALPADGESLPILRRFTGTHCHEGRAMQIVVRDPATFAQIPLADVPVDFSREMLLIVTLGRVTSDQFVVSIDRVWREGPRLRVGVAVAAPPPNAPVAMATPYCMAVVPRCDLNVADFAPEPPPRDRSWQQSPMPSGW